MTVENMRGHIKAHYNYATKWCAKVDRMPDDQVIAVYYRLAREAEKKKLKQLEQQELEEIAWRSSGPPYTYVCDKCGTVLVRDNPELEECEFCGNQDIKRSKKSWKSLI